MRVEGVYEDAVAAAAAAEAVPGAATLADVAYDDADPVAHWVADGYSTIFAEAAEQADVPFDVMLCQIGVGSFAVRRRPLRLPSAAAGDRDRRRAGDRRLRDGVARRRAGRSSIDTPGTSMAGLNCATPSHAAWPVLRDGLAGTVVISDDESHAAMRDLAGAEHRRRRLRRRLARGPARAACAIRSAPSSRGAPASARRAAC